MEHDRALPETEAFPLLDHGFSLVTVNRRLSRALTRRFHLHQEAHGRQAWETPDILPWPGWIARSLTQASYLPESDPLPQRMNQDQELAVWEDVIRSSNQARGLLHVGETSRLVSQAWTLFREWRLHARTDPLEWSSPDHEAFLAWSQEFQDRVDGRGWLEEARHPELLAELLRAGQVPPPPGLILAGFDHKSPMHEHILHILLDKECPVHELAFPAESGTALRIPFQDREQEIRTAALWAGAALQARPEERIGIVVPNLVGSRNEIIRIFDQILHPDAEPSPLPPEKRVYDLSLGRPLTAYPLIQSALCILELDQDPLPLQTVSALLASPFILGGTTEVSARGGLEAAVRRLREPAVSWSRLLHLAEPDPDRPRPCHCPQLVRALRSFQARMADLAHRQAPSAWARTFDHLLRDMGWPGERTLLSDEYQTLQAWNGCLHRMAGLDRIIPEATFHQARSRLNSMLAQTIFQPERPDVPIQIMGVLEAAGERFHKLWVLGMTDQVWPPPSDPNPFLPPSVQRRLGMPRSCPDHELEYARRITARLQHSAPEALFSHPLQEEDRDLLPSPLILHLPEGDPTGVKQASRSDPWTSRDAGQFLESFQDDHGPELPTPAKAPGGSGLLRSQAACPFQGFARHRLRAESLEEPVTGLGPLERGIIIHSALEAFWSRCHDQATLLALTPQQRLEWTEAAVQQAIHMMRSRRPVTMIQEFTDLERERLQNLLLEWLDLEAQRAPFAVQDLEKRLQVRIQGLELNVVADRIDRLENGKVVIIDYKSGRHSLKEWALDRPVEPQLPLYSLFSPHPVAGLSFGVVRKGDCRFVGLSEEPETIPGCKGYTEIRETQDYAGWDDLLSAWKNALDKLALEVVQGVAQPVPASSQTCRQCDLQPLCRIFESGTVNI